MMSIVVSLPDNVGSPLIRESQAVGPSMPHVRGRLLSKEAMPSAGLCRDLPVAAVKGFERPAWMFLGRAYVVYCCILFELPVAL
jgi:hypothetical protein